MRMKIPNGFTSTIADTFYDKEITPYVITTSTDDEGFTKTDFSTEGTSFMGNVSFNMDRVKKDYGIDEDIDIKISTHEDVDGILEYDSVKYEIVKKVVRDTHIIYLCKKWLSRASDLISL